MDKEKINTLNESLEDNSNIVAEMSQQIMKEHSNYLDKLMVDLRKDLTQPDAISTDLIERYYADLSSAVYFMCESIEKLNIMSDLSRAKLKEAYNKAYIEVCSEKDERGKSIRTVNENTSLAENESKYEATLNIVYDQTYKTLRMKVDMALEMISTLKNILKRRTQEEYLNSSVSNMRVNGGN